MVQHCLVKYTILLTILLKFFSFLFRVENYLSKFGPEYAYKAKNYEVREYEKNCLERQDNMTS